MIKAKRIKVLGHHWTVQLLSKTAFKRKFGDDTCGIADMHSKEIFIANLKNKREIIIHELVHAYIHEMCIDVADLSSSQMEEICGDLIAKYGERIMLQTDAIRAALMKGRK